MRRRLLIWGLAVGLGVALAAWLMVPLLAQWQYLTELRLAQREMNAKRFDAARARLLRLSGRWPGRGEVEHNLGVCELQQGHTELALAAWGRVPDTAPESPRSTLSRGRLAFDLGRYRLAETCLERASQAGGETRDEADRILGRLYWMTGRAENYRRILRREVERMRDPSGPLRTLWEIGTGADPVEGMRQILDKAHRDNPDDDRVWLGLASLESRAGRFDEAGQWLAQCEQSSPEDPAVWQARLDWAKAAGRPDEAGAGGCPSARGARLRKAGARASRLACRPGRRSAG